MSDNKNIQDGRDRSKVSGSEEYEVEYIAQKLRVTPEDVRNAIQEVGNNRELVEAQIQKRKSER